MYYSRDVLIRLLKQSSGDTDVPGGIHVYWYCIKGAPFQKIVVLLECNRTITETYPNAISWHNIEGCAKLEPMVRTC